MRLDGPRRFPSRIPYRVTARRPSGRSLPHAALLAAWLASSGATGGAAAAATASAPRPLSPAGSFASPALAASCPTFSWAGLPEAQGYELVVFRAAAAGDTVVRESRSEEAAPSLEEDPSLAVALRQRLPAGATSWTPDLRACLAGGARYAWSLRALGGRQREAAWSEPAWLDVDAEPSLEEVEHALDVLRRHRASQASTDLAAAPALDAAGATPVAARATRAEVPHSAGFEPLRSPTVGPRTSSAAVAPPIGTASLTVSQQVHLDEGSAVFKNGELFLWDGIKQFYGPKGTTAVGRGALKSNQSTGYDYTGIANTALGYRTLGVNTTGFFNTASGAGAMRSNTTGERNTAHGARSMYYNSQGGRNTALGTGTLFSNSVGSDNTAVGWEALVFAEGSRNTAVGYRAGQNLGFFGSDNVFLNSKGQLSESHTLRIGEGSGSGGFQLQQAFIHGIFGASVADATDTPVLVDGTGKLGTGVSSARFKQDIADIEEQSARLLDLRPVSFRYRPATGRGGQALQFGLIAEEVAEVFPELVLFDEEGRPLSVKYHLMSALLLDALQQQHGAVKAQQRELESTRADLAALRTQVDRLASGSP